MGDQVETARVTPTDVNWMTSDLSELLGHVDRSRDSRLEGQFDWCPFDHFDANRTDRAYPPVPYVPPKSRHALDATLTGGKLTLVWLSDLLPGIAPFRCRVGRLPQEIT